MATSVTSFSRLLSCSLLFVSGWAAMANAASPAEGQDPDISLSGSSYFVEVPVVSAFPIEVTRVVERPEKLCRRLDRRPDRRADERWETDWQPDRSRGDYGQYSRRDDYTHRPSDGGSRVGAQILGGLIGGVIGNQFGGGRGKKALTVTGALLGASVAGNARGGGAQGSRYDRDRYDHDRERREIQAEYSCQTTTRTREITEVTGYDVTYRYNNSLHKRRMEYDPGDTLELRVRAVPEVAPDA